MKAYTDLNQSKKLTEILPLESADMYYEEVCNLPKAIVGSYILHNQCMEDKDYKKLSHPVLSPTWSLAALLDILDYPQLSKDKLGGGKVGWMVSVYPNDCRYDSCWHDNPVDACCEMIIKLNELKML